MKRQMKKGNKIFEELYREERRNSKTLILNIVKNEDVADDICEDVFVKLYELGDRVDISDRRRIHALITVMSYNKATDYFKKASVKYDVSLEEKEINPEAPAERYNPEAVILRMEENEYAKLIFQKLRRENPVNYDIFVKVKYMGLSPGSVAEEYGFTVNNVNNRILRTKRWLAKEMKEIYR